MLRPMNSAPAKTDRADWFELAKNRARDVARLRRSGSTLRASGDVMCNLRFATYEVLGYPAR